MGEKARFSIQAQEVQRIWCCPLLWSPLKETQPEIPEQGWGGQEKLMGPEVLEAEGIREWMWVLGRAWGQTKIGTRVGKEGGVGQVGWLDSKAKVQRDTKALTRSRLTFETLLSLEGGKKLYESPSGEYIEIVEIYTCIDSFTVCSLHVIAMIMPNYAQCSSVETVLARFWGAWSL